MSVSTTSGQGSRKRLRISSIDEGPSSHAKSSNRRPYAAPLPTSAAASASTTASACRHEEAVKALYSDIDAMRQLVTCKICARLLYEPYALSCGHTYCYSCLSQWLGSHQKMTCPDCRTVITQEPTPSYLIREMVLIFVSRSELLPDGETSEEHNIMVREEAAIVAIDKSNTDPRTGGLFRGRFKIVQPVLQPLHDPGDGVDRCPSCHWELEDGFCNHCNLQLDEDHEAIFSELDYDSDEDLDHELDAEDAEAIFGAEARLQRLSESMVGGRRAMGIGDEAVMSRGGRTRMFMQRQAPAYRTFSDPDEDDDSESDESDEPDESDEEEDVDDPSLAGFIVDEDDEAEEQSDASESPGEGQGLEQVAPRPIIHARRRYPTITIDDDDDDGPETPDTARPGSSQGSVDDLEEDEAQLVPRRRICKRNTRSSVRQRRAITVSSGDESDSLSNDQEGVTLNAANPSGTRGSIFPNDRSPANSDAVLYWPSSGVGDSESETSSALAALDYNGMPVSDEVEESEDDYHSVQGLGVSAETPSFPRAPIHVTNHRLDTMGHHSSRHRFAHNVRAPAPQPMHVHGAQNTSRRQLRHPFHLDSTLTSINNPDQRARVGMANVGSHNASSVSEHRVLENGTNGHNGASASGGRPAMANRTRAHK